MSNSLFAEPRPTVTKEIIREVIEKIAKQIDCDAETLINRYDYGMDGCDMMNDLCRWDGWDVDQDLIDGLDEISWKIDNKVEMLEKAWAERNNIQPQYSIGTKIKEGVIEGIYTYSPGRYLVKKYDQPDHDNSRLLIKFEKAELLIE